MFMIDCLYYIYVAIYAIYEIPSCLDSSMRKEFRSHRF